MFTVSPRLQTSSFPMIPATPPAQKHAAIRHMSNRMNTYQLNDLDKNAEYQTIEQIVTNNGYDPSIIQRITKSKHKTAIDNAKISYAKFTYFGKETRALTKLFKEKQLQIAYKVGNTFNKRLSSKPLNHKSLQQQYERSGVYSLICPDCHMQYTGQTGRSFQTRFKEHFHDFKYNIRKSNFASHLLNNNHSIGPIKEIMKILYTTYKGRFMDTVERFHIYKETQANNQINDRNTVKPNAIFDVISSHSHPRAPPLQLYLHST